MASTRWPRRPGHIAGGLFGILIFLAGVALLALTFKLAIDMFGREPAELLGIKAGKALDLNNAGTQLIGVVLRIFLLLVMAIVGGMIANRGIRLYADSKPAHLDAAKPSKEKA
jgi:hypothetical protein